jgi:chaperone modulatory protein CbpM
MTQELRIVTGVILDEECQLSLRELTHSCRLSRELLAQMVAEGLLQPRGPGPENWRFPGPQVRRAQRAARLMRDLELDLPATALVLELLEEVERLRARVRQLGA